MNSQNSEPGLWRWCALQLRAAEAAGVAPHLTTSVRRRCLPSTRPRQPAGGPKPSQVSDTPNSLAPPPW